MNSYTQYLIAINGYNGKLQLLHGNHNQVYAA